MIKMINTIKMMSNMTVVIKHDNDEFPDDESDKDQSGEVLI